MQKRAVIAIVVLVAFLAVGGPGIIAANLQQVGALIVIVGAFLIAYRYVIGRGADKESVDK